MEVINESLDINFEESIKPDRMSSILSDFFKFSDNLAEGVEQLKTKHNLYTKVFYFKRRDYLQYIKKERNDIKSLAVVFDIPPS